jgi:V/A-type H+/Na+-transporting ATPase subunit D
MMERISPTRMELIRIRAQIKVTEQGRDLLRLKMEALIREFYLTMESFSKTRDELETVANDAYHSLVMASAVDGTVTLKAAAFTVKRGISLEIMSRNVMGVEVPVIEKKRVSRTLIERGYGIVDTSGRIDEAAEKFEAELDILMDLAEKETAIRRLGSEIQRNRRRVNALEQIIIPELKAQAGRIKMSIDEREREDLYRLRKVKKTIESKKRDVTAPGSPY